MAAILGARHLRSNEMGMMRTVEGHTDPLRQFVGGEQPCRLDHLFLAMQPLRLDGVRHGLLTGR